MSIYSGGDKQWRDAEVFSAAAQIEQNFSEQRAQRRSFLQDIRQARIAQAYNEWAASSSDEYVTTSGTAATTGNVFSNFSGAYRYAIDQYESSAKIENLQLLQAKMEKRAAKRDKRAATATQITMAALAVAGGALGAAALGGVAGMSTTTAAGIGVMGGAAVGKGAVSAMSPGRVARETSTKAAVSYGITGATMAIGGMMGGSKAAATTELEEPTIIMSEGSYRGPMTSSTTTSTSWMSSLSKYKNLASLGQSVYNNMGYDDNSYYEQNNKQRKHLYTIRARRYS